jgi:hypothetical protein
MSGRTASDFAIFRPRGFITTLYAEPCESASLILEPK